MRKLDICELCKINFSNIFMIKDYQNSFALRQKTACCRPLFPQFTVAGLERTQNVVNVECDVQFIAQCSQPETSVSKHGTFVPSVPSPAIYPVVPTQQPLLN